ncbi:tetratricopeptide repeat protein [Microcoleus sp. F10-C6]|uniref:tetratricopeptide repeat protein n=1 Tax=unclassified Microcoleus TaxID=2642155 RepID=UPI002FCEA258
MESTQKKSSARPVHRSDRIKQILTLVSIISFGGSTAFGLINLFTSGLSSRDNQKHAPVAVSQESLLAAQERGYVTVLQREPQNQTALEGLANVRLQMNNKVGAIEPLEKLVKLNPDRGDYKELLGQLKSQGEGKK